MSSNSRFDSTSFRYFPPGPFLFGALACPVCATLSTVTLKRILPMAANSSALHGISVLVTHRSTVL